MHVMCQPENGLNSAHSGVGLRKNCSLDGLGGAQVLHGLEPAQAEALVALRRANYAQGGRKVFLYEGSHLATIAIGVASCTGGQS
jgi:hypothetical protein